MTFAYRAVATLSMLICLICVQAVAQSDEADQHYLDGNYNKAFSLYQNKLLDGITSDALGKDVTRAVSCLQKLNRVNEFDEFIEAAILTNKDDWRVLQSAAESYLSITDFGSIIDSEFVRGSYDNYIRVKDRDRVRSLQLLLKAEQLLMSNDAEPHELASVYRSLNNALTLHRNHWSSWQLQELTDLKKLPEYYTLPNQYLYHTERSAPTNPQGNPIYYELPKTFDEAKNDGERWRFYLNKLAETNENNRQSSLRDWADFVSNQFGVATLAYNQNYFNTDNVQKEKSIFSLSSLTDEETIAKLASGIRRFTPPKSHNAILIYQSLAKYDSNIAIDAAAKLASIYQNRRQLKRAITYWQRAIKISEKIGLNKEYYQTQLDQIVGAWGHFEPNTSGITGTQLKIQYKYRNGSQVKLELFALDAEKLLREIKTHTKKGVKHFKWTSVQLDRIGYEIVQENQRKYISKHVKTWNESLTPSEDHYDSFHAISLPQNLSGAHLLKATMAGGNTTYVVVWNNDVTIVQKPFDDKILYYVTDAITGEPEANTELHFFGYKHSRDETNIQQHTFNTDEKGLIFVDNSKLDRGFNWIVHTDPKTRGFAHIGFSRLWYNKFYSDQYQQTKAHYITNQPVYRPDQTVKFNVWIANASYDDTRHASYENQNISLVIRNPKYEEVFTQTYKTDKYGGIQGDFKLPKNSDLGIYSIEVNNYNRGTFRVEEYKKPEFEVTISTPEKPVELGKNIDVRINANYLFGAPVTKAKVKYTVSRIKHDDQWYPTTPWDWFYGNGYWWFAYDTPWLSGWRNWGYSAPKFHWQPRRYLEAPELVMTNEINIGENGEAIISIDTLAAKLLHGKTSHRYKIDVEIIDQSRRSVFASGDILVAHRPFSVYTWLDRGYYQKGEKVHANFKAQTINGNPIEGKGKVRLYELNLSEGERIQEKLVEKWSLDTNANGEAKFTFNAKEAGQYRLSYTLTNKGNKIESGYVFTVYGKNLTAKKDFQFNELELVVDKKHYQPDDKIKLLINSNYESANILLFLRPERGNYKHIKSVQLNGKTAVVPLDVSHSDMPNFFIEAVTVFNGEVHTQIKEIIVPPEEKIINVDIAHEKNDFLPGEKAKLNFSLTGADGNPFEGSTVIAVYDKALEYISGGTNVVDIKKHFWQWRRHHSPNIIHSAGKIFYNIVASDKKQMQPIGIFGHKVIETESDQFSASSNETLARSQRAEKLIVAEESIGLLADSVPSPASFSPQDATPVVPKQQLAVPTIRQDFADSAFWLAQLKTNDKGHGEVEFELPENLTTWKTAIWAMGPNTQVGQNSTELITKKNIILRMQTPRFFVETDEVVLSANIHNYLNKKTDLDVVLDIENNTLTNISSTKQSITLLPNGEKRVDWRVKVKKEGTAIIRMSALGEFESDAVQMEFPVYVHGMKKTDSYSGVLNRNEQNKSFTFSVPAQRKPDESHFELRYSPSLAGAIVDALPYLIDYPYGCTEQTLSRFIPTVIVQNSLIRSGLDLDSIRQKRSNLNAQEIGDDLQRAKQWHNNSEAVFDESILKDMVNVGLKRIYSMQLSDGGWGWFSGYGETSSAHTTAYAVRSLLVAQENGIRVDPAILTRGIQWLEHYQAKELQKLKNGATNTTPYKLTVDNLDAFVHLVLIKAKSKSPDISAMSKYLFRDKNHLSVYAKAMLALSLHRQNKTSLSDEVKENIEQYLVIDEENQTAFLNLGNNNYWWYWYGSEFEALAYYLKLLSATEPQSNISPKIVKYLLNNRKHAGHWKSTRDTALVVEAFVDYLAVTNELHPDIQFDILLDGTSYKTVKINRENVFSFDNKLIIEGNKLKTGEHEIKIVRKSNSKTPLYFNAYIDNFTLEDFIEKSGLEIKVERRLYKLIPVESSVNTAGSHGQLIAQKQKKYKRIPVLPNDELKSSDLLEVELILESKNDYEYVLVEDMKAAGFEPIEVKSGYTGDNLRSYVEYRDNRVVFFISKLNRGTHTLNYRVKAETPGKFSALPTRIEAMYAPELRANSDENKFTIVEN